METTMTDTDTRTPRETRAEVREELAERIDPDRLAVCLDVIARAGELPSDHPDSVAIQRACALELGYSSSRSPGWVKATTVSAMSSRWIRLSSTVFMAAYSR